ncbi:hypothetical protein G7Y89_g9807 [Cudoniella acicularis]|uniref:Uncharacterized protein n=1 Tax=Cudoniella acicularis TaxID=354080 RepID=A0A8H4VZN5_9HELO|nr:hypothetical protein G7Y89_g9807 [Cudoniella acicularis]
MSSNTTILITGANRGIGRAITKLYLSRPNTTLIAGVRDPTNTTTTASLSTLPLGQGSKLVIVKIESSSETDAKTAISTLPQHGITHLDLVIANAGIGHYWAKARDVDIEELKQHYLINSIAPLVLFQAALPLLKASKSPKFVTISSALGSIAAMENIPLPSAVYGSSKAALNFTTRKIHQEEGDWGLVAFSVHPGWLKTELGNAGAAAAGLQEAPETLEVVIPQLVSLFDTATREKSSGHFLTYNGTDFQW